MACGLSPAWSHASVGLTKQDAYAFLYLGDGWNESKDEYFMRWAAHEMDISVSLY